jgi:hypothetical protein
MAEPQLDSEQLDNLAALMHEVWSDTKPVPVVRAKPAPAPEEPPAPAPEEPPAPAPEEPPDPVEERKLRNKQEILKAGQKRLEAMQAARDAGQPQLALDIYNGNAPVPPKGKPPGPVEKTLPDQLAAIPEEDQGLGSIKQRIRGVLSSYESESESFVARTVDPESGSYVDSEGETENAGHRLFQTSALPIWTSHGYSTDPDFVDDNGNLRPLPAHPYGAARRFGRGVAEVMSGSLVGGIGFQGPDREGLGRERLSRMSKDLHDGARSELERSENPEQDFIEIYDYAATQLRKAKKEQGSASTFMSSILDSSSRLSTSPKVAREATQSFLVSSMQQTSYEKMQEVAEYLFDPTSYPAEFRRSSSPASRDTKLNPHLEGKAAHALPLQEIIDGGFAPLIPVRALKGSMGSIGGYYKQRAGQAGNNPAGNKDQREVQGYGRNEYESGSEPPGVVAVGRGFAHLDGGSGRHGVRHGLQGAPQNVVYSYIGRPEIIRTEIQSDQQIIKDDMWRWLSDPTEPTIRRVAGADDDYPWSPKEKRSLFLDALINQSLPSFGTDDWQDFGGGMITEKRLKAKRERYGFSDTPESLNLKEDPQDPEDMAKLLMPDRQGTGLYSQRYGPPKKPGLRAVYTNGFDEAAQNSEGQVREALVNMRELFTTTQPEFNDASVGDYGISLRVGERNPNYVGPSNEHLTSYENTEPFRVRGIRGQKVNTEVYGTGPSYLAEGWFGKFKNDIVRITNQLDPQEIIDLSKQLKQISDNGVVAATGIQASSEGLAPYRQKAASANVSALVWDEITIQHFADIIQNEYRYASLVASEY